METNFKATFVIALSVEASSLESLWHEPYQLFVCDLSTHCSIYWQQFPPYCHHCYHGERKYLSTQKSGKMSQCIKSIQYGICPYKCLDAVLCRVSYSQWVFGNGMIFPKKGWTLTTQSKCTLALIQATYCVVCPSQNLMWACRV